MLATCNAAERMKVFTAAKSVAFPATEYNEVLSGYQPGRMVERCKNQRFEDHPCPLPQGEQLLIRYATVMLDIVHRLR
jgi:hypothetical protein